jgi:hypothetical protein
MQMGASTSIAKKGWRGFAAKMLDLRVLSHRALCEELGGLFV